MWLIQIKYHCSQTHCFRSHLWQLIKESDRTDIVVQTKLRNL